MGDDIWINDELNKAYNQLKETKVFFEELRDRTKDISILADKLIYGFEDPIYFIQNVDEMAEIPGKITFQLAVLTAFLNTHCAGMNKEE